MKSYKYLNVSYDTELFAKWVILGSTDSQVLDWISAEAQKLYPSSQVRKDKLPSGEVYGVFISEIGYDAIVLYWWILKQLCLKGWEPFAVEERSSNVSIHHLRLEVTDNGEDKIHHN